MPQPPPRKVKPTAALKSLHSEQVTKLQAKHQQECDLLEDIRTFSRQRAILEKDYAQALQKLTAQLLKRDFQAMPDLTSDDGQEHRTAMHVWRVILEETDLIAKKRLQAAETYLERIAEPVKPLKTNKVQCMKKVQPQLTTIQAEVGQTVLEMTKAQKTYTVDETQSHDARVKTAEAEDKLNKRSTGIFQSLAGLQKNHAKLQSRKEQCETKSTGSRNEYVLCMAAANAHQVRYFTTDLPELMDVLDGEIFENIQEYFSLYGGTARDLSCMETRCCDKIIEQTNLINRNFDLKCFLYTNRVFTDLVQYEFDPCLDDKCNRISKDNGASHDLDKEARKWATKIAKENKAIRVYQRALKTIGAGDKISESGSAEVSGLDPEVKGEELLQNIRKAETARAKAEARIEALRSAGVNVEEWLSSANVDSLGVDEEVELHRAPSRTSIKTDSSEHTDDQEPTYTHYDEDDDFMDETFDVSVRDYGLMNTSSSRHYPVKCRSIYDFIASNEDELNLVENEEVEIVADGDGDGWVRARKSTGEVGLIPENYIVMVEDSPPASVVTVHTEQNNVASLPSPDDVSLSQTAVTDKASDDVDFPSPPAEMMADFPAPPTQIEEPSDTVQSPMSPSDVNQEVTSYSSGDIEVQLTTSMMAADMQLPVGEGPWVRALYDYCGTTEDELSFTEGTLIKIVRKDENGIDDGFWEGEINGKVGVFPSLVVEELENEDEDDATDFPSPLKSPPDFIPPPPVTITAATPDTDLPPAPIANGTANIQDQTNEVLDQFKKKVRFGTSYRSYDVFYDRPTYIVDDYDSQYDDDGEESIV